MNKKKLAAAAPCSTVTIVDFRSIIFSENSCCIETSRRDRGVEEGIKRQNDNICR